MADRAIRIRISGRVQGVGFRAWTQRRAVARGVSGWVHNCPNGDVEALLSGPPEALEGLLAECREGPRLAVVAAVEVVGPGEACEGTFTIRRDTDN